MAGAGVRVAVTGATGYIGTRITLDLLERGYQVRAIVRDPESKEKCGHLHDSAHGDRLSFFKLSDLNHPEGLEDAFQGATYVVHTATAVPVLGNTVVDVEKELIGPAINGTKAVMVAARQCGVKRVVVTASMVSICGSQKQKNPDHVWTEADWNDEMGSPYSQAKTKAERAAWDFVEANKDLEIATIHPALVLGPIVSKRITSTKEYIFNLLNGSFADGAPRGVFGVCDIRDVSLAHITAMERDEARNQRYLVGSRRQYGIMDLAQLVEKVASDALPGELRDSVLARLPKKYVNEEEKGPPVIGSSADPSKVEALLGAPLTGVDLSIRESIRDFVRLGLVKGGT
eukprot:CAMPEP_0119156298 /NCGR_PEP_ID=MMETSP1310-20130426/52185_1 /TAXON_ID=464262 /ORGANISM="Genus nov. species nov., Strain RCC2339" /LENGTH=343 /DNA_ID=CAMNT_0007148909 /DNA_START=17 /DNA_END=1048 /DNA_ORIENTATION=-